MAARSARRRVRAARHELYRQLVLEAAERVFAREGYDEARMEAIAQEAGLSLQTLYSVWSGKAEIHRAIHESADAELLARGVAAARGAAGPLEALLAGVRGYTRYFLERPDFLRMHLHEGFAWGTEQAGARSRARTDAWRAGVEMLARAFRRCIEAGVFAPGDPHLMARTMIAMQQVHLAHWLEGGMRGAAEDVVAEMEAQVVRAFRRDPPHATHG